MLFSGIVRDHAVDEQGVMRTDVQRLVYEAYESQAEASFQQIADEVRVRWPNTGRVVLLHRTGELGLGESSVVAVVSAPHRPEAFEAARYAIDALKASAPIWKHETWLDPTTGEAHGWGTGAHDIVVARQRPHGSGRIGARRRHHRPRRHDRGRRGHARLASPAASG